MISMFAIDFLDKSDPRHHPEAMKVADSSLTQNQWKWQAVVCHFHLWAKAIPSQRNHYLVKTLRPANVWF